MAFELATYGVVTGLLYKDKRYNIFGSLFEHLSNLLNEGGKVVIAHSQSREEINHVHSNS